MGAGVGRPVPAGHTNDDETAGLCAPTGIAIPIAPLQNTMPTPVPPEVLAAARAAAEDSLVRFAAGDTSVTDEETLAYKNLIQALKLSGVRSPAMELIDRAGSPGNFRTA